MATQLQFRRYTTAELAAITGAPGELIVDTDLNTVTVHDGVTAGGQPALNISADSLITVVDLGTNDPVGDGIVADLSAEGVALDGTRWKKVGAGPTEWEQILMSGSGIAADVNPSGPQIVEALDTKLNSNYAHLTYFGDASGVVTMKNIIGELASSDVPAGSVLVQIGNSVTSIGSQAFYGWGSNNQPLVIPDSVISIGYGGFSGWSTNNQPLVIPDSVISIGYGAFGDWESNNQPLVIPDSVTEIGNQAFYYWNANNQPLVIGDSVTSIGNFAFGNWTANNQPLVIGNSVETIGRAAFQFWITNNQPLVIPDSVETIGDSAFRHWSANNQPLVIPDSVETIETYAFFNWAANNQPLVIGDSVTSIGNFAFQNWTANNQPLVIGASVTEIGSLAFRNWSSNNQPLVIPDSVETIGDSAFRNWTSMTEPIYCGFNFSAFTASNAFLNNGVTQIYVKPGATGWTIGVGQEIQGASGITVSNWNNYPIAIPN
jgi:hypothetical protein